MTADRRAYQFGAFVLDPRERQLLRQGVEVRLRPRAFETLSLLVRRHGHVVTKNELMDHVWTETNVSPAVLTHCIAEIRQALGDDARCPAFVKTVSLTGYRFVADVSTVDRGEETGSTETGCAPAAGTRAAPATAIAVLPFTNLSGDPETECLCDGLSEELINALTTVPPLRVVAHSSAFSFKGRDVDARDIGRQLKVGSILEGSVRKSGDRLRISVQLIDAAEGYHVWSEQYDRRLEDVFAIQDDISTAILERVKGAFAEPAAAVPLVRRLTPNMEAYQLYLKGRGFWHRRYQGFLHRAIECFQQAIELDRAFALAYAGLADSFSTLGIWAFASPASVFPRATELADRALEIDDHLAEAHASRALIRMFYDWEWDAAGDGMARAVDLNPGNALIRLWNGHYYSLVGRWEESIGEVLRAQDLDPLSPITNANVGWTFSQGHDHERAISELHNVLAVEPMNAVALFYLGYAYAETRRYADALATLHKAVVAAGGMMPWAREFIAWVHAMTGDPTTAETILHESLGRMREAYVPSSAIALIHLGLGDRDAMFEWLAKAVEERDPLMPWMKFLSCFDTVRDDRRFRALLHTVGLDSCGSPVEGA